MYVCSIKGKRSLPHNLQAVETVVMLIFKKKFANFIICHINVKHCFFKICS